MGSYLEGLDKLRRLAGFILVKFGRNTYLNVDDLVQEVLLRRITGDETRAKYIMLNALARSWPCWKKWVTLFAYDEEIDSRSEDVDLDKYLDICGFIKKKKDNERKIIIDLLHGYSQVEIAYRYNISERSISPMVIRILTGKVRDHHKYKRRS